MASHRGAHPEDEEQFACSALPELWAAVRDLAWLRSRGYGDSSALKLVGDRYRLKRRQRDAVARSACSDSKRAHRLVRRREPASLSGRWIDVDGFNVLISVEGMLGGAYLFIGRDRAYRDVGPVQGTYRIVNETVPALRLIRDAMKALQVSGLRWCLDAHVSNVGRLQSRLADVKTGALGWTVCIQEKVDSHLCASDHLVATSDSGILDQIEAWCSIEQVLRGRLPNAPNVCDLRPGLDRGKEAP